MLASANTDEETCCLLSTLSTKFWFTAAHSVWYSQLQDVARVGHQVFKDAGNSDKAISQFC